jgi:hypothetical protein
MTGSPAAASAAAACPLLLLAVACVAAPSACAACHALLVLIRLHGIGEGDEQLANACVLCVVQGAEGTARRQGTR